MVYCRLGLRLVLRHYTQKHTRHRSYWTTNAFTVSRSSPKPYVWLKQSKTRRKQRGEPSARRGETEDYLIILDKRMVASIYPRRGDTGEYKRDSRSCSIPGITVQLYIRYTVPLRSFRRFLCPSRSTRRLFLMSPLFDCQSTLGMAIPVQILEFSSQIWAIYDRSCCQFDAQVFGPLSRPQLEGGQAVKQCQMTPSAKHFSISDTKNRNGILQLQN